MKKLSFIALLALPSTIAVAAPTPGTVSLGLNMGFYGNMPSGGFELNLNLGPKWQVGLGILNSQLNFDGVVEAEIEDHDKNLKYDLKETSLTRGLALAHVRMHPFAGSFNIGLGLATGTLVSKFHLVSEGTDEEINEELKYKQTFATFTIGNNWRWKYFYVGCDWIGYAAILNSSKDATSKSSEVTTTAYGKAYDEFVKYSDRFGENGGVTLFNFKIGVGF